MRLKVVLLCSAASACLFGSYTSSSPHECAIHFNLPEVAVRVKLTFASGCFSWSRPCELDSLQIALAAAVQSWLRTQTASRRPGRPSHLRRPGQVADWPRPGRPEAAEDARAPSAPEASAAPEPTSPPSLSEQALRSSEKISAERLARASRMGQQGGDYIRETTGGPPSAGTTGVESEVWAVLRQQGSHGPGCSLHNRRGILVDLHGYSDRVAGHHAGIPRGVLDRQSVSAVFGSVKEAAAFCGGAGVPLASGRAFWIEESSSSSTTTP